MANSLAKRMSTNESKPRKPKRGHRLPHGEGSFYHRVTDNRWVGTIEAGTTIHGKRRRIVVTDKDEGRAWDKLQVKRKILLTEGRAAALQTSMTLEAWLTKWLEIQKATLRPEAYNGAASYVRRWMVPTLGRIQVEDLTPTHVRKLRDTILNAGRSSTHAGTIMGQLQTALRAAQSEGLQVSEGVFAVKRPPKSNTRQRTAIPLETCWTILDAVLKRADGARWVIAFLQGMRPAEVLGLTWDAIDFDAGTIDVSWQLKKLAYNKPRDPSSGFRVPIKYEVIPVFLSYHLVRPKTEAGLRVIPLIPWMRDALLAWREVAPDSPSGLVFPRPNGLPRIDKDDTAEWKALQDSLGAWKRPAADDSTGPVYWDAYEIRHSTATLLLAAKVDPEVVKAIMGHSDILVTRGYQHADIDMKREALEKVAAFLKGRPEPVKQLSAS